MSASRFINSFKLVEVTFQRKCEKKLLVVDKQLGNIELDSVEISEF